MSSERWKKYKLGDIVEDIAMGPFGSNIKVDNFVDQGVPVIRGANLNDGGFTEENFAFITEEKARSLRRSLAFPDDLVFTHRGTIGQVGIIPYGKFPKYLVSQSQMRLTVNKKLLNPKFLYYFFKSPIGQYELLKNASQVGVPAIAQPTQALKDVDIQIPNLESQEKIGSFLSKLDEKIELNRQTNATLEAIAQAIFKEWFVNFNYPGATGEVVESELGPIPKGWRVGKLEDISETIDCLHSKKPERVKEKTDYLLLQLCNILDSGHVDLKNPYWISQKDYLKWISRIEAEEGISVITNVGRYGVAARIPGALKAALGRNMTAIRVRRDFPYDVYLILLLKSEVMAKEIEGKLDPGTIMDSLNVRNIPLLRFVLPPIELVAAFEKIVKPIWIRTDANIYESALLEQVRDSLLPKLMSGEIQL